MAFNDALFQLGMDLTRSSTAQTEDHFGSALVAQEDCHDAAGPAGDVHVESQRLFIDLVGAKRIDSAKRAEAALWQAFEQSNGGLESCRVHKAHDRGCLVGHAELGTGSVSFEAWPATGYVAVDIVTARGLKPEQVLTALMDAFGAREATIKRQRTASDGARYKKAATIRMQPAPIRGRARAVEQTRTKRAA